MASRLAEVFTPFEDVTDPRMNRTKRHELFDVLVVALCGTLAGSDTWQDVVRFGNERLEWLRTFLPLANGVASHDTFERVFRRLDPAQLVDCLQQWIAELKSNLGEHIAIDGKTLRGSFDTAAKRNPLHLVSAYASEARLVLGQVATEAKSNEITAIPLLLEMLELRDTVMTIDAMGCQKEIAKRIKDGGGDYVLSLKDNHPALHQAVAEEFTKALEADALPEKVKKQITVEKNRGREERREYYAMPAPKSLPGFDHWMGLCTIVMVMRMSVVNGVEQGDVHYYISSLPTKVKRLARLLRAHWKIESMHWMLDVTFAEDKSRERTGNGPQTHAMLRRLALSILSRDTSIKDTMRGKRYRASLNTNTLERILLGFPAN